MYRRMLACTLDLSVVCVVGSHVHPKVARMLNVPACTPYTATLARTHFCSHVLMSSMCALLGRMCVPPGCMDALQLHAPAVTQWEYEGALMCAATGERQTHIQKHIHAFIHMFTYVYIYVHIIHIVKFAEQV